MTITSIQRPVSLQTYSRTNNSNYTQSDYNATQSEIEFYIQSLINEGNVFQAKYHMEMVNTMNGYPVISQMQFKQWRVTAIKLQKVKNEISNIKIEKSELKKRNSKNQNNDNSNIRSNKSQKQKSKIKVDTFQVEYQKAYMKMISN